MKSILLRLYDGEICPAEQFGLKTEEYRSMRQAQYQHYEDFIEKLKSLAPPLHEKFIDIMDEQLDTVPLELSGSFLDGFRLGARMMIEVYQSNYTDLEE
ncbi:DUF6809 family protein [Murimonas intestini]|uniref:Uncharacterized protein n=1 Tax=Murimonas intestini TaxID=1337051 RepID=A0AB73SYY6_9FIRM|nr:DUF6809 family protein [Murimonas intestini]MCR1842958.1 hypothetical protein [Murimonas intestini]MCR1868079.1 hypothetical protein [Murimonas intestini]MCR1885429.1 hypothetical protein [Murimonas intestini]